MKIIRYLFLLMLILCVPFSALAANYYVRADATGANNGSDWNNAYSSLPAALVRGATYYVADGNYGSYTFNDADSGSLWIYIKKAIGSDHGTETGWSSAYGDGQAFFEGLFFDGNYFEVDGQAGIWASDWPNYAQHGIVIRRSATGNNSYLIRVGDFSNRRGPVTIKHVEAYWQNTTTWYRSQFHWYGYGDTGAGKELTIQYCWFHLGGGSVMTHLTGRLILDHSFIEENANSQAVMNWQGAPPDNPEHSVLLQFRNIDAADGNPAILRYNIFRRFESTGGVTLYDENDNYQIYGNIFLLDPNGGTAYASPYDGGGNGVLNGLGAGSGYTGNLIYNNTFTDMEDSAGQIFTIPDMVSHGNEFGSTNIITNNIFNSVSHTDSDIKFGGSATHTYNWYYDVGTAPTEATRQLGAGDPFVNRLNNSYRIPAPTIAGDSTIGNTYGVDAVDVLRGQDGVWDRGAFEYESGTVFTKPKAPTNPIGVLN